MSYGVQSASLFGSTSSTDGSSSTSLRPFANLDLTEDQRKQIRSIFQTAKSQGLSQSEIQQEIEAILTPAQVTTLQNDLASQTSNSTSNAAPPPPPPPGPPPPPPNSQSSDSSDSDLLDNLELTDDQKTKIDAILEAAQNGGTSQTSVLSQIESILTPAQQSAFLQDVQTAQAYVSGQSQSSGGTGSTSTTTNSSSLTETDVKNQIAAATSLILQQFESELSTT